MASKKNIRPIAERKPTHADAEIALRLYEQRREDLLRKARNYVNFEFAPQTTEEYMKVGMAFGTQEQTYLRMVLSYWEQSSSLVARGVLHSGVFDDFCGEMYFVYAKYRKFIPAVREMFPNFLVNVETVANRSKESRERVDRMEEMISERFRARAVKAAS